MSKKRNGKKVNGESKNYTFSSILRKIRANVMMTIIADGPTRFKKKMLKDHSIGKG